MRRDLLHFFLTLAAVQSSLAMAPVAARAADAATAPAAPPEVLAAVVESAGGVASVRYAVDGRPVAVSRPDVPAGLEVQFSGEAWIPVLSADAAHKDGRWVLGPARVGAASITFVIGETRAGVVERTAIVEAREPTRFRLRFSLTPPAGADGAYASWSRDVAGAETFDTTGGSPEYPNRQAETFPVAMFWGGGRVVGVVADAPGRWENRCIVDVDRPARRLAVITGDGSATRTERVVHDSNGGYACEFDGWQHAAPGAPLRFTTWVFADRAADRYQAQLAAHLALANAKGWNASAVQAILRNTSYLLLRRNLMRAESRFIFISGIGYGWKQWATDAFYAAVGLDDAALRQEAYEGLFESRLTYEDNCQYYLIWSALQKRAGGRVNDALARRALAFIRTNARDGFFVPVTPANAPVRHGFKTYHDLLEYDDDDSPTSDQGFQCAALAAARELGFDVTEAEVDRATAAYRSLFNADRGFYPTSRKQRDTFGGDALYAETLAYAALGRRFLPDDDVRRHVATSLRLFPSTAFRVIAKADGSLLPGHAGQYVFGGSWFLCDHAALLAGLIHGTPPDEVDRRLVDRVMLELRAAPAFNESIDSVHLTPFGHALYSADSGYAWIRPAVRARLGSPAGLDPVDVEVDRRLGVSRAGGELRLGPRG